MSRASQIALPALAKTITSKPGHPSSQPLSRPARQPAHPPLGPRRLAASEQQPAVGVADDISSPLLHLQRGHLSASERQWNQPARPCNNPPRHRNPPSGGRRRRNSLAAAQGLRSHRRRHRSPRWLSGRRVVPSPHVALLALCAFLVSTAQHDDDSDDAHRFRNDIADPHSYLQ